MLRHLDTLTMNVEGGRIWDFLIELKGIVYGFCGIYFLMWGGGFPEVLHWLGALYLVNFLPSEITLPPSQLMDICTACPFTPYVRVRSSCAFTEPPCSGTILIPCTELTVLSTIAKNPHWYQRSIHRNMQVRYIFRTWLYPLWVGLCLRLN